ncbi:MAG: methylmalonyl-CoA mutase [Proteobacteria bacterium]|nr:methylmalonyl-CoA mutase [Pseudomonadota bacterium]
MDTETTPLAEDFPPAAREDWERAALKALKGEPLARLRTRTADGLVIEALEPPAKAQPAARADAPADPERPWDLRTIVDGPEPARANADLLHDLENGAASILLALDPSGAQGVAAGSAEDLGRVLEGVLLDLAPVALDAGWMGPDAANWLAEAAKGGPAAPLAVHMDPLGTWAREGLSPGAIAAHVQAAAETAAGHAAVYPKATFFLASGRPVHEAGGSEGWELGFTAAAALAYARAMAAAGVNDPWARIVLGLSADVEHLTTIAKLRAARMIWAKLTSACGVRTPARIEARSSRRMLAKQDSWSNLLRLTAAGFGAAVGGAEAVVLEPFTAPLAGPGERPSGLARRQARNIQLVLMEEAGLGRVADAAGGSGYIETLTDGLARAGWAALQGIEGAGGLERALESGVVAGAVAQTREARRAAFADGTLGLIGVTRFPPAHDEPPAMAEVSPAGTAGPEVRRPGADSLCPPLTPVRWAEPFEGEERR